MSTLMKKLTELAQSPQGKKLVDKAQQFANDPKTKEQVEKAKLKFAEIRGGAGTAATKDTTAEDTPDGPKAA